MNDLLEILQYRLSVYTLFASFSLPFAYFGIQTRYPANSIAQRKAIALLTLLSLVVAGFVLCHIPLISNENFEYRLLAFLHLAPPLLLLLILAHVRKLKGQAQSAPAAENSDAVYQSMRNQLESHLPDFPQRVEIIRSYMSAMSVLDTEQIDYDYLSQLSNRLPAATIKALCQEAEDLALSGLTETQSEEYDSIDLIEAFEEIFEELAGNSGLKAANS